MNSANIQDLSLDLKEVYRYLGYKKSELVPKDIHQLILECYEDLKEIIQPVFTYKAFNINYETKNTVSIADSNISFKSKNFYTYAKNSPVLILCAASLGFALDKTIELSLHTDKTKALIIDALGSSLIESLCDYAQNKIGCNYKRFSPGYGDFKLEHQKDFETLLNMYKATGISINSNYILNPSKRKVVQPVIPSVA